MAFSTSEKEKCGITEADIIEISEDHNSELQ